MAVYGRKILADGEGIGYVIDIDSTLALGAVSAAFEIGGTFVFAVLELSRFTLGAVSAYG